MGCQTRRPASADRTVRRHVLPMGVGAFAFRYQGNGATPWQYIDTTRKAVDCATTLPLTVFGRLFVKRFALCYWSIVLSCPVLSVCLSACDVDALWPNGWADQDETWHAGRSRPWPHCVRWGPSFPSSKGAQRHSPPILAPSPLRPNGCMDQDATWCGGRPRPRRLC